MNSEQTIGAADRQKSAKQDRRVAGPGDANQNLLRSAQGGIHNQIQQFLDEGADINIRDEDGMTALHHVAALGSRGCIRVLVNAGRCDYLIRDNEGRYASDLAIEWGRDAAVGRLLTKHQMRQARERGVPAWLPRGTPSTA